MSESDKKVILLVASAEYEKLLETNLASYLGINPIRIESLQALNLYTSQHKDVGQIITDPEVDGKDSLEHLSILFKKNGVQAPVMVIGGALKSGDSYQIDELHELSQPKDMRSFLKKTSDYLDINIEDLKNLPMPEYMGYSLGLFQYLEKSPCDIFVRIGKGSRVSFIKICHEGDAIDPERIESIKQKGGEHLYVKSVKRLKLTNVLSTELSRIIDESDESEDKSDVVNAAVDILHDRMRNEGPSAEMAEFSKKIINKVTTRSGFSKKIYPLLKRLIANKSSFSYKFIQVTSFFATVILKKMDWRRIEQVKTLAFAAIYRDIALEGDETMLKIRSEEDLEQSDLSEREKKVITTHAQKALSVLEGYPDMPYGVEILIRQHHGSVNGAGFPNEYSQRLSPLSIVLMVAEEAAFLVIDAAEKGDKNCLKKSYISKAIREKFKSHRFVKIIEGLEESL